jgi:hypothetical protein
MQHCCNLSLPSLACRDQRVIMCCNRMFRNQCNRLRFQSWIAALLLSLYIAATIGTDLVHQVFHEHQNAALHTAQQEKDPCHRSVYHHDTHGCDHQAHVSKIEKGKHCHVLFHTDQLTFDNIPHTNNVRDVAVLTRLISPILPDIDWQQFLRGPPAC